MAPSSLNEEDENYDGISEFIDHTETVPPPEEVDLFDKPNKTFCPKNKSG